MNAEAPYLVVRAGSVYLAAVLGVVVWAARRPNDRETAGAALATAWNIPALLALHVAAQRFGWWDFDARGGLLLGMPVDLYLAWACLWGLVPALAFPRLPLALLAAIAAAVDLVLMPAASPVVVLGRNWLVGECAAVLTAFVPAQLLARWTARDVRLVHRAMLQMVTFGGLVLFVIPAIAMHYSGAEWRNPLERPAWELVLIAQAIAAASVLGLSALQEFVERGDGTPVPFDPPRRLVTTGPYAYIRNPMQLSGVLLLLLLGPLVQNLWISLAGVVALLYSLGLAGWDEEEDLRTRFANDWPRYRAAVPKWMPRWRPCDVFNRPPARLFVAESCGMCSPVGRWFERRTPEALEIIAAEAHPRNADAHHLRAWGRQPRGNRRRGPRTSAGASSLRLGVRGLHHAAAPGLRIHATAR